MVRLRRRAAPPAIAGRYVPTDRVGLGGSGTVWRAWDVREERYVAVKVLRHRDPALVLRFVREQSLRIHHRHVLAPRGWAAEDDVVALATDLVRGGSLAVLAGVAAPLAEGFVTAVLDQALQALVAVHAAGVVHGDVKPANLLLEPTGRGRPHVRLADFGVATVADGVAFAPAGPAGTPAYLAPELAAGAAPHPSQDVYALGVTGRRLLAPSAPAATLLASLTRSEPALRPSAAAALERLRALPVRRDRAWPSVPDRIGPDPPPPRLRTP
ncbi:serine/threonine-protein kinase [Nocardioides pantholopis]|uniref:serine/threonine-protein kinase n=1 Tax=Nocardioides pantholopis TaxID=2483798 RepID=UPI0019D09503|nr:serine/threonine-protein kinase [Nocardioides pantholopis]